MKYLISLLLLVSVLSFGCGGDVENLRVEPPPPNTSLRPGDWGEFRFLGTTYKPTPDLSPNIPVIEVDFDAHFEFPTQVNKVLDGNSPFPIGSSIVFVVHSPSLLGIAYDRKYVFVMDGKKTKEGKWEYYVTGILNAGDK